MAPRVHNSGHWTIEGAVTSQFENHLRAILGLPLGDSPRPGHSAMINLIGTMPDAAQLLRNPACTCTTTARNRVPGASSDTDRGETDARGATPRSRRLPPDTIAASVGLSR